MEIGVEAAVLDVGLMRRRVAKHIPARDSSTPQPRATRHSVFGEKNSPQSGAAPKSVASHQGGWAREAEANTKQQQEAGVVHVPLSVLLLLLLGGVAPPAILRLARGARRGSPQPPQGPISTPNDAQCLPPILSSSSSVVAGWCRSHHTHPPTSVPTSPLSTPKHLTTPVPSPSPKIAADCPEIVRGGSRLRNPRRYHALRTDKHAARCSLSAARCPLHGGQWAALNASHTPSPDANDL
ncbi:hypothetical protein ANO11243_035140 [Dothideomycetidae sp. 11243]|nr:hypothetical protein ANO11243_035140 [fungal sp. No.11243]